MRHEASLSLKGMKMKVIKVLMAMILTFAMNMANAVFIYVQSNYKVTHSVSGWWFLGIAVVGFCLIVIAFGLLISKHD